MPGIISADFNHTTDKLIIRYDADVITLTEIKKEILKKRRPGPINRSIGDATFFSQEI